MRLRRSELWPNLSTNKGLTILTYEDFADLAENHPQETWYRTNTSLGQTFGVSEATIRRWKLRYASGDIIDNNLGVDRALAALRSFKSDLPEVIEYYGSAMICGDVHVPLTRLDMVEAMFRKAKENGLSTLILAGDLFNFDSLGRFDPKQRDHTLAQELQIGREFVGSLLDTFEHTYIIKGNHEDRFMRALGYKLDFEQTMQLVLGEVFSQNESKLTISNLDHMYLYGPEGQKYYVNHPKAYSRQPLATGRALASKHNCNIICGHAHHHAVGTDISGKYVVAELGGLFDIDKTAYLREATTFPRQQNGLIWVDESGKLHTWSPLWES